MKKNKTITVFEHQRLHVGENGFKQLHLDALLKLNEYHSNNYFEPISRGVKFNQFVGVLQVDGLTIEIHPKADKDDTNGKWKGVLLKMLKACGRIKARSAGNADVKRQNLNLLEVYFELFLLEVEGLIRKGLIKKYRNVSKNTKSLKGKLEFSGHIRRNIIHKERFFTTHQVYDTDHLLHRTLFKALTIVSQFSGGTRLQDSCNRVILNFPDLDKKSISKEQIEGIRLDRKTQHYEQALDLARLIILNYSPDISSGKEKMLSLLFDMNSLWEEYILKQLRKYCKTLGIEVSGQESKSFWGYNMLRPDIVLRYKDKIYIIDTKWKRPKSKGISVEDLRQIYTYCRFWNADKGMLLYPGIGEDEFKIYKTDDYLKNHDGKLTDLNHQCKLGLVSVLNEDGTDLNLNIGKEIFSLLEIEIDKPFKF